MKFSLDHFENKYGLYTGKRLLFAMNSIVFFIVMLIAINSLGINPFSAFPTIRKAVETVIGISTFEDIVSDSTLGVLDATVSSVTMYNTIFMLFIIIIPIMILVQGIHIAIRVIKVNRLGKQYREPDSYFVCENNKQITRHFSLMMILLCMTVCLFLPFFTEPNLFFGDSSLGIAEFLTISAVRAGYSSGYYDFQTSMILSMLFSMLSVAFIYILSSCITVLVCSVTSSLENSLGKEARQIFFLNILLLFAARYGSEHITGLFIDSPVVLHFNIITYILLAMSFIGFVFTLLPLGRKIDSEK